MKKLLLAFATLSILAACEKNNQKTNVELVQDMMEDKSIKAQDYDLSKPDKRANLLPPEHTVPMNWTPYPNFQNDEQAKGLKNPVQETKEWLAKGEHKFQIYCGACHGAEGRGNGLVAEKMLVKPPSLLSDKIRGWTDGQIFHLATKGRGMMGGYESQMPDPNDRWAIIVYIRHLQKELKDK
jgi:hypothetical protein